MSLSHNGVSLVHLFENQPVAQRPLLVEHIWQHLMKLVGFVDDFTVYICAFETTHKAFQTTAKVMQLWCTTTKQSSLLNATA